MRQLAFNRKPIVPIAERRSPDELVAEICRKNGVPVPVITEEDERIFATIPGLRPRRPRQKPQGGVLPGDPSNCESNMAKRQPKIPPE
jgi:hypothetical protein